MKLGAHVVSTFISSFPDGSALGAAHYFGMPIRLLLEPAEQDGKRGYRLQIHIAPLSEIADGE